MSHSPWHKMILAALCTLVMLSGCGQKIKESVKAIDSTTIRNPHPCPKIVMLPFADYSTGKHIDDSLRRQIKVQNAIAHKLASKGYYTPMEEDVVQYLIDLGVITLIEGPSIDSARTRRNFYRELGTGWCDQMNVEIRKVLLANEVTNGPREELKMNRIGLDKGVIRQIGNYFGADYILRGRIVEYEMREGQSLNPLQQGILPFFFDWTSSAIFGVAQSEQYDLWQDLAIGGSMGAALGSQANTPFNGPSKSSKIVGSSPRLAHVVSDTSGGFEQSAGLNAAFWGAAGMATAYLASKGGHIPRAVVQISLALQDPETGEVVWANRVEKEVEPESMWADNSGRTQMDLAVEEAAKTLLEDLTNTLAMCPKCNQAAQASVSNIDCEEMALQAAPKPAGLGTVHMEGVERVTEPAGSPENWGS
ncbi:MAG: hypothetical protein GXO58_00250 [Thermodesulfobacteria bacterium]|nr:hypothetical protein [Thermodesulfobacteriota bacterium]